MSLRNGLQAVARQKTEVSKSYSQRGVGRR
jgi:hypothetical protein